MLCSAAGCPGEAAPQQENCIQHMSDDERAVYLRAVARGAVGLTLAGLTVSGRLFAAVLAAMPQDAENPSGQRRPLIPTNAFFDETEFVDYVDAQHVTFAKACHMTKAVFRRGCIWNGSRFGTLDLRGARIVGPANLDNVTIDQAAIWTSLETTQLLQFVRGKVGTNLDLRYAKCAGIWISFTEIVGTAFFSQASFDENLDSGEAQRHLGRFDDCRFRGAADFTEVRFPWETTFGGYADMVPAQFDGHVNFSGSTFGSSTHGGRHLLQRLVFKSVTFDNCKFYGRVSFANSKIESHVTIGGVRVQAGQLSKEQEANGNDHLFPATNLDLTQLRLPEGGELIDIGVEGSMAFSCVELGGSFEGGGITVSEELLVSGTTFQYFPFQVEAKELRLSRCQFARGGVISGNSTSLSIVECDSRQPMSVVTTAGTPISLKTLDRTNVENFTFVGVDFSKAALSGAINLDKIRIQGQLRYLRAPRLFGQGREAILDEALAREGRRWRKLVRPQSGDDVREDPRNVASLYRALRKNREDSKDEPGGADFYYGEMEMRRAGARRLSAEWFLLNSYWLVSGYGLRAWRALLVLSIVVFSGGILLREHGFPRRASLDRVESTIVFAETSIGLSRLPDNLTTWGSVILISGRLLCPILIALAILALRGRVKR